MPLVDYSDSDSDTQPPAKSQKLSTTTTTTTTTTTASKPISSLPPLPTRFHDLYAVAPRIGSQDDPSFHGGRKRSVPHVSGNWPTHVFLEWHLSRLEFELLDDVYSAAAAAMQDDGIVLQSHLKSELGSELPLHLSLSRPNVLATAQREGFLELLRERVEKARVKPFDVEFTGFEWVCNSDQTRWFLVLKASKASSRELPRLLQLANRTFEAFAQPALYGLNGDGFHVSLAWCLQKPAKATVEKVSEILMAKGGCGEKAVAGTAEAERLKMGVEMVKVKIGNAVHTVELKSGKSEDGVNPKKRRLSYS